jgi:RNA polymerase sigma-70 factor (ECF subfamily)
MLAVTEESFSLGRRSGKPHASRRSPDRRRKAPGFETTDEVLIEAIARGERDAMERLARHHVRVFRFAVRLTGNPVLAEDIVSEVFFCVWRQAAGFKAKSNVSTWLFAIARNKSVSAIRQRHEPLDDDAASQIEDSADNPEVAADKNSRDVIIRRCLSRLSAHHREVIDLVYYHEKSVDEVAEIIGAPAGTVKTRMFYARRQLQDLLAAAGVAGA